VTITVGSVQGQINTNPLTIQTEGGQISLSGYDLGLNGSLANNEYVIISTTSNPSAECINAVVNGNFLTCDVPPGYGTGNISVTLCGRKNIVSFKYKEPVVTQVVNLNMQNNNLIIAIRGENFGPIRTLSQANGDFIQINGQQCTAVISVAHTEITCTSAILLQDRVDYNLSISIGFQVLQTQFNITICNPECQNGGNCVAPNICDCTKVNFQGFFCDEALICIPDCIHGSCVRGNEGQATCQCLGGYKGNNCGISTSNLPIIVGAVGGSVGFVVVLSSVIIIVILKRRGFTARRFRQID